MIGNIDFQSGKDGVLIFDSDELFIVTSKFKYLNFQLTIMDEFGNCISSTQIKDKYRVRIHKDTDTIEFYRWNHNTITVKVMNGSNIISHSNGLNITNIAVIIPSRQSYL